MPSSDHFNDYMKLLVLRKNGSRSYLVSRSGREEGLGELIEVFSNYASFFVHNMDRIGFLQAGSLCVGGGLCLSHSIDTLATLW